MPGFLHSFPFVSNILMHPLTLTLIKTFLKLCQDQPEWTAIHQQAIAWRYMVVVSMPVGYPMRYDLVPLGTSLAPGWTVVFSPHAGHYNEWPYPAIQAQTPVTVRAWQQCQMVRRW